MLRNYTSLALATMLMITPITAMNKDSRLNSILYNLKVGFCTGFPIGLGIGLTHVVLYKIISYYKKIDTSKLPCHSSIEENTQSESKSETSLIKKENDLNNGNSRN